MGSFIANFDASLLLLLLSCFSRIRLCASPWMAACQAPPLGFSRQEHLEWVAISVSSAWKWKVKVKSLNRVRLLASPRTAAYQAPPSWDFTGKSSGVGCHCRLWAAILQDSIVDSLASSCCTLLPHHHCSSWAPFSPPDLEILAYTLGLVLGPLL